MPILTKDGKEYRTFSEPNPLMTDQEKIENSKLEFHNFEWKKEVKKANETVKKAQLSVPKVETIEEFIKEISEAKKELKEPPKLEPPKEESKPKLEPPKEEPKLEDGYIELNDDVILIVHVLPIHLVERTDELYGEVRKIRKYGTKFDIECVLMEISDLSIQILSDSKVETNFIIYPSKYRSGEPAGINRWWRVIDVKEDEGNYLIQGMPSDFHPDFSS